MVIRAGHGSKGHRNRSGRHCCINAKTVLGMYQSREADPSSTLQNRSKPGI
jgi:hypothetical protein